MQQSQRILIGSPVFEYHRHCFAEFFAGIREQACRSFDLILVDNSADERYTRFLRSLDAPVFKIPYSEQMRDRMTRSRNLIRDVFLQGDYSHLFFVDQDVVIPPNALENLLLTDQDIVSGIYCKEIDNNTYAMVILPHQEHAINQLRLAPLESIKEKGVIEIAAAGFGCLLIKRAVLETLKFHFDPGRREDADLVFCEDALKHGFELRCNTLVECKHYYILRDFSQNICWGYW